MKIYIHLEHNPTGMTMNFYPLNNNVAERYYLIEDEIDEESEPHHHKSHH
jgi:hypothetical protein